jgi:hypothetical protein
LPLAGSARRSALPFTGSFEASSPASTVLWRCATPCAPLAALRCLRLAIPCGVPVVSLPTVQDTQPRTWGSYSGPHIRTWPQGGDQGLPGSRTPHCPFALFFDPGRTEHARPSRRVGMAPAMTTTKAPTTIHFRGTIARLQDSLFTLRKVRCHTRRKTRFRPLAKRHRTGLLTRRVVTKGFWCYSSSSPELSWRKDILNCSYLNKCAESVGCDPSSPPISDISN